LVEPLTVISSTSSQIVVELDVPLVAFDLPTFYLSQGPPAL